VRVHSLLANFVPIIVIALFAPRIPATDWPQWLGPKRDAIWMEQGLLKSFPKDGPKVIWRQPISEGYAGPAVTGGRVFITDRKKAEPDSANPPPKGTIPGTERVLCLNADDGKTIWSHTYDCPYVKISYPSGPRTTPVVEGDRLYTLGTMGDLLCLNAADGKVIWSKNFIKDYRAPVPLWGWSAHLLLDGEKLFALVGGEDRAVMAFDKKTGKEFWNGLNTKEICYAPPMIAEAGGKKQLIVWLAVRGHLWP